MVQAQKTANITSHIAILLILVYGGVVALSEHIFASFFLPILFSVTIYKEKILQVFKKLLWLNLFVFVVVLTMLFQNEYSLAILITLRSNLILLFMLLLFCDKDEFAIAMAIQNLYLPKRLVTLFFFTTKSIFLIKRELELLQKTLLVRGFSPKTDRFTYESIAGVVALLYIKACECSMTLQKAMLVRGFKGEIYTLRPNIGLNRYDVLLFALTIISLFVHFGELI